MAASNLRGILSMLAAVVAFTMMDVCMKRLVETYPVMQVTFLRGAASLPLLLAGISVFGRWADLLPRRWGLHLLRGVISVLILWAFIYSVSILSLADAYAIFMSAPLLITALSVPLLGEHVGWRRWLAVVFGLLGVIAILRPSGAGVATFAGIAALAAATGYAVNAITIRMLARTDTAASTLIVALAIGTVISGVLSISEWIALRWEHWPWIAGVGIAGALGQYFITTAFRHAPAGVLAPLEYTALVWGMLFDWLLWLTLPSARMLAGAAVVVGSGLYVIYRERVTQQE